jgi:hypothetical protein
MKNTFTIVNIYITGHNLNKEVNCTQPLHFSKAYLLPQITLLFSSMLPRCLPALALRYRISYDRKGFKV